MSRRTMQLILFLIAEPQLLKHIQQVLMWQSSRCHLKVPFSLAFSETGIRTV